MAKPKTVAWLEEKRAEHVAQIKLLDAAIKAAKEKEIEAKQREIVAALQARGLLDQPLDALLAAIEKTSLSSPTSPGAFVPNQSETERAAADL